MSARIFVLAGVNGAGKSSIGGAAIQSRGADYFNPDLAARDLRLSDPQLSQGQANAAAWELGRAGLERALREGGTFAFETTLGARTLPDMLLAGSLDGAQVHVWYAGLTSPALHLARVRERVRAGGHDIPEAKIRERYDTSRANLIRLLPHLASLRLYDNSVTADPKAGARPEPRLLLHLAHGRLVWHAPLGEVPNWAKPILARAFGLPAQDTGGAPRADAT